MEAALLSSFGVDPLDPAVTPRRLWVLLQRLPPGAWPGEPMDASWSVEAHMLASLIDAVQWNTWVTAAASSKRKPKQPKPIKRPGEAAARRQHEHAQKGKRVSMKALMASMEEVKADG